MRHPHHYNPNQPRVPKGHSTGGRWTDGNHGQATILEEGDRTRGRYGQDTILQPPRQADGEEPPVQLAFLGGLFRGALRTTPNDIAREKAAREKAIKDALAWFSALSAANTADSRAVIEFEAHQYGRDKKNTLQFKKLGILTREEFDEMCKRLEDVQRLTDEGAREANGKPGLDERTYGTDVHEYVKKEINKLRKPNFWAERSAIKSSAALPVEVREHIQKHGKAPNNYPDTVRTDGYEYLGHATACVYDVKTGEAEFPPSRRRTLAGAIFATDDIARLAEAKKNIAAKGLPILRIFMTVVRPTVPRILNPR